MINKTQQEIYDFADRHYDPSRVAVDIEAIKRLELPTGNISLIPSFLPAEVREKPTEGIAFMLALNAINYMFWRLEFTFSVPSVSRYAFDGKEGAMGMRAAFDRFWVDRDASKPLTAEDIQRHFGDIPDAAGRAANLNDMLGSAKVYGFAAELYERILATRKVDADDAAAIARAFPVAYTDPFHKRSQLALAMIAGFLGECGIEVDTAGMTLFADYQVPRSLRALGPLKFSPELAALIDSLTLIPEGEGDDYAICSAVVKCGRAMSEHFGLPQPVLDNVLWQYRKLVGPLPFQLVWTRRY